MKLNTLKQFAILLITLFCLSCDQAALKFTFVNKTARTLTIYIPRQVFTNTTNIYNAFKPSEANSNHIRFSLIAKPYAKIDNFSMYSFASQFKTTDGKLHLIILDVDLLKSMALKHTLDSNSISRAILKHLIVSKEELEEKNKIITYKQ